MKKQPSGITRRLIFIVMVFVAVLVGSYGYNITAEVWGAEATFSKIVLWMVAMIPIAGIIWYIRDWYKFPEHRLFADDEHEGEPKKTIDKITEEDTNEKSKQLYPRWGGNKPISNIEIVSIVFIFMLFVCMIGFGLWCWFLSDGSLFSQYSRKTDMTEIVGGISLTIGFMGLGIMVSTLTKEARNDRTKEDTNKDEKRPHIPWDECKPKAKIKIACFLFLFILSILIIIFGLTCWGFSFFYPQHSWSAKVLGDISLIIGLGSGLVILSPRFLKWLDGEKIDDKG